jgi:hypothetical protein
MGRFKTVLAVALGWWLTAQSGVTAAPPPRTPTSLGFSPSDARIESTTSLGSTAVPEIDPGASAGALTLLVGSLLTLCDRRAAAPRQRPSA